MTIPAWLQFVGGSTVLAYIAGNTISGYFQRKKNDTNTKTLIDNTMPVSNGTIPAMREDIKEIRDEIRASREDQKELIRRFDSHISDHLRWSREDLRDQTHPPSKR